MRLRRCVPAATPVSLLGCQAAMLVSLLGCLAARRPSLGLLAEGAGAQRAGSVLALAASPQPSCVPGATSRTGGPWIGADVDWAGIEHPHCSHGARAPAQTQAAHLVQALVPGLCAAMARDCRSEAESTSDHPRSGGGPNALLQLESTALHVGAGLPGPGGGWGTPEREQVTQTTVASAAPARTDSRWVARARTGVFSARHATTGLSEGSTESGVRPWSSQRSPLAKATASAQAAVHWGAFPLQASPTWLQGMGGSGAPCTLPTLSDTSRAAQPSAGRSHWWLRRVCDRLPASGHLRSIKRARGLASWDRSDGSMGIISVNDRPASIPAPCKQCDLGPVVCTMPSARRTLRTIVWHDWEPAVMLASNFLRA